jgi:NitT/TauT family transport system substrate-binding protein
MHVCLPRWFAAVTAAVSIAAVAGCGSTAPVLASGAGPEKPHLVVAAVRATDEVPLYLAEKDGFFRQQGLNVTVVPLNTSTAAVPRLVNGTIDVIAGANYVSFFGAQARGVLHIKVIAPAGSCTGSDFAVLTLPGSTITRPADLAGKTITEPGPASVNTLLIDAQLAANGVSPAKARFLTVPFVSSAAALHAHRVDAISLIEPFLTEALANGAQTIMPLCTGPTANLPLSGDITIAAWAARYPRTAAAYARALAQGAAVAAGNHAAEEEVLAANVPITPASLVSMVNFNTYPLSLNPVQIQQVADLMYEDRLLTAPLNVAPLLLRSTR